MEESSTPAVVGGRRPGISWRDQTLASLSAPPMPLMVIFGVVILLLYLATFSDYKSQVDRSLSGLKLFLFLLPLLLILVVHFMMLTDRWFSNFRNSRLLGGPDGGGFPVWLLLLLFLLLVAVYHHSFIKSAWFHPV